MESMETYRKFLKTELWLEWKNSETDQKKKIPRPLPQKPYPKEAKLIELVSPRDFTVGKTMLIEAIRRRKSHRKFTAESLNLEELSFLLWATQGVRKVSDSGSATWRTVPSGGSLHPFETYLVLNRVTGVEAGLYRYLSVSG